MLFSCVMACSSPLSIQKPLQSGLWVAPSIPMLPIRADEDKCQQTWNTGEEMLKTEQLIVESLPGSSHAPGSQSLWGCLHCAHGLAVDRVNE